jgi:CheY-like chemotaxis protein
MSAPILVVDNEPDIQTLLRFALEGAGYRVSMASNGAEALRHVAEQPPALILLDLYLPVMTGWEVYPMLRREQTTVPILIMTAAVSARAEARQLGADGWLAKPFELDDLLRTVARFAPTSLRFERLLGIASEVYSVYDGARYVGVVGEVAAGQWQAMDRAQHALDGLCRSRDAAGRLLSRLARGA